MVTKMKTAGVRDLRGFPPRNGRRGRIGTASVTATDAKREFGRILETAIRGGAVVITKHGAPKAVLVPVEEFDALSQPKEVNLDGLRQHFDTLVARMQGPKARAAMQAAFDASPAELGRAALAGARRRK
jgi:prevent-host-death family protein